MGELLLHQPLEGNHKENLLCKVKKVKESSIQTKRRLSIAYVSLLFKTNFNSIMLQVEVISYKQAQSYMKQAI